MKVKELREILAGANEDYEVILSKDAEGNDFSPLADVCTGIYEPITTWHGEFDSRKNPNAICLWPTN